MPALFTSTSRRPCLAKDARECLIDLFLARNIHGDRLGSPACFDDRFDRRERGLLVKVEDSDARADPCEALGDSFANSLCAAGHDGDLAIKAKGPLRIQRICFHVSSLDGPPQN